MFKTLCVKRITIATLALIILGLLCLFPSKNNNLEIEQKTKYNSNYLENSIYLLDKDEYVARVNILYKSNNDLSKIKEIIESLTINSSKKEYIPNGFTPLIPEGTKLLNFDLQNNILKINFSKDILKVNQNNEEKMIEALIYSLTTIDNVKKIMIFVEGNQLQELPHSKKSLPLTLDRNYGINKVYNIDNIKNTTKTTVYFINKFNDYYYYVPVTKINNEKASKIEIIIEELKSSPNIQTNLMSFLNSNTGLLNYEILEDSINLSFNKYLLDDFEKENILEEVKYAIALSVKDSYEVSTLNFYVSDKLIDSSNLLNLD